MPAYGDYFVTQGFIYPSGTLERQDKGVECELDAGVPTNCTPLYEPIGRWTCYGVFVGDGAATDAGAWVVAPQVFEFERNGRPHTIVTDGFERPEVGVTTRAITGGTGRYANARGEQRQDFLGLQSELGNFRAATSCTGAGESGRPHD